MAPTPRQTLPFEGEMVVSQFKDRHIRKLFHEGEWHFSIVDVIAAITEPVNARRYWSDLKRRLTEEGGGQLYDGIVQLKLIAEDGKERLTDAANTETLFRIIQSVRSPKAEPFKRWLAKVGYERLQEVQDPALAIKRAITSYRLMGYPDEWIDARIKTIASRNELTSEWSKRGISEGLEYALLTDVISLETFDMKTRRHKEFKGLAKKDSLRDHMTDIELILTMLGEKSTTSIATARDAQGFRQNENAAHAGGRIAGNARKHLEHELGRSVVSPNNYLEERSQQDQLVDEGRRLLP